MSAASERPLDPYPSFLLPIGRVRGPGPFAQPWLGPGIGALVGFAPEPTLAGIAVLVVLVAIVGVGGAVGFVLVRPD